jgi:CheY-like chemotaxis protein
MREAVSTPPDRTPNVGPVLVIDNEPGIREVIRFILESHGHEVTLAEDAGEARRALDLARPRAILLEVMLPGEDGLSFCRKLKVDPRYRSIPVLMITGRVRRADRDHARAAGAEDLITKPFDERAVLAWLAAGAAAKGQPESP